MGPALITADASSIRTERGGRGREREGRERGREKEAIVRGKEGVRERGREGES